MKKNPGYKYEFYDDNRIDDFFKDSFNTRIYRAYRKLQIGAAKADFFRYAVLYKTGGVYLDLDSDLLVSLDEYLKEDDTAFIAREGPHPFFTQWALVFDKNHPFLERVIEYIVENIEQNKFPHDVHSLTGPAVYTRAINDVITENPDVTYRMAPDDYRGLMQFKYKLCKFLIYKNKSKHWKKLQQRISVLKDDDA